MRKIKSTFRNGNLRVWTRVILVQGLSLSLLACGGLAKHAQTPHRLESTFGHVLFTESIGHFPQLAKRTKPKKPKTVVTSKAVSLAKAMRADEGELPTITAVKPQSTAIARKPDTTVRAEGPLTSTQDDTESGADGGLISTRRIARAQKTNTQEKPQTQDPAPAPLAADTPPVKTVPTAPKRPAAPLETAAAETPKEVQPQDRAAEESSPRPEAPTQQEIQEVNPMLTAAQRLLDVDTGFTPERLISHLITLADLDIEEDSEGSVIRPLYSLLESSDRTFSASEAPSPGDIVFFSNTYDRDQDERPDDWFTMAGVVEEVDSDGTIQFIGFANGKVQRLWLNLERPGAIRNESYSKVLNSQLRPKSLTDRPFTQYYAGELFASFGRL